MNTHEELFNRFDTLSKAVKALGNIVQNENKVSHEDLDQYEERLQMVVKDLEKMKHRVVSYYQRNNLINH